MFRLLIIAAEKERVNDQYSGLARKGFACSVTGRGEAMARVAATAPDLVLLEMDDPATDSTSHELARRIKQARVPVIALVRKEVLDSADVYLDTDDFITLPGDTNELAFRSRRLLLKAGKTDSSDIITCGQLTIDTARCEVLLDGSLINLTFREYELLKFLVSNRGHVFSRESLLNKVWGYDFYGGDRTVDVHIRRLRSKIELSEETLIETVRNIGYRFK